MKKQLTKAISKKVLALLLVVAVSCSVSPSVYALGDTPSTKVAEITYEGIRDKKVVFNINYKNELSQPFQLTIRNDQDDLLYAKQFDSKPLVQTVLFAELPDNCKLIFNITSGKKEFKQVFEINTQVKTVEEFIVKGL